jgi:hypothetical protein
MNHLQQQYSQEEKKKLLKACKTLNFDFNYLDSINYIHTNKAIITLSQKLWFPTGIAFIGALAGSYHFIATESTIIKTICCLLSAVIWAFLIRKVDIHILRLKTNLFGNLIRILLSLILSCLSAMFIDHLIFATEIKQEIDEKNNIELVKIQNEQEGKFYQKIDELKKEREILKNDFDTRENLANKEAEGLGSGVKGAGSAEKAKRKSALVAKQQWLSKEKELKLTEIMMKSPEQKEILHKIVTDEQEKYQKIHEKSGLLHEINAFFSFLSKNTIALFIWAFFFLLCLIIELIPLYYKWNKKEEFEGLAC